MASSAALAAEFAVNGCLTGAAELPYWLIRIRDFEGAEIMLQSATAVNVSELPSMRQHVSAEEWEMRVNLAALYRISHHLGISDRINTHYSARVPGEETSMLLNPYGPLFDEITASSLVKLDGDGNKVDDGSYDVNPAGYIIHSAVLDARPDVNCVIHTHTMAAIAVSALKEGLLPLSQHSMQFYNRIGYHDYEGFALDSDERARMAENLGPHKVMMLRNHGTLIAGTSIADAFVTMDDLEKCCQSQLLAQAANSEIQLPPPEVCEHTAQQFQKFNTRGETDWEAYKRLLDRQGIVYAI